MATRALPILAVALATLAHAGRAEAQGCVAARQSSPAAAGGGQDALGDGQWQLSLGTRWFRSSRHFVGTTEQKERRADGSQFINEVTTAELEVARGITRRTWLVGTLPYLIGERSAPVYGGDGRTVVARSRTSARGIGDATIGARAWVRDPVDRPHINVAFGLSIKWPTGEPAATAPVTSATGPTEVRTVDASIQPGDGGIGFSLSMQAFALVGKATLVASGTYLVNPRETNGVPTFRSRPSEAFLSVPDAYLARAGVGVPIYSGVEAGLGGRFEGTPVHDVVGGDGGFRRPGFTLSAEPSLSFASGAWTASVNVPVALVRNRQQSVPERQDGVRGDAAFADYSVLIGVSYRFDAPGATAPMEMMHAPARRGGLGQLSLTLRGARAAPELGTHLTVVNVWATWCRACREEVPLLNAVARAFGARGVKVVGVSVDEDEDDLSPFLRDVPMDYATVWAGPDGSRDIGEPSVPVTLVLDGHGAVVHRVVGGLAPGQLDATLTTLLGGPAK